MSLKNVININIKLTPRRWTFHLGPNSNFPIIATTTTTTTTADETDSKNQLIKVERHREMTKDREVGEDIVSQMLRQIMERELRGKTVEERRVESGERRVESGESLRLKSNQCGCCLHRPQSPHSLVSMALKQKQQLT